MKNKERFPTYDAARFTYDERIVPEFGATKLEFGFGRWLWIDYTTDNLEYWMRMARAGILTQDGRRRLERTLRNARKEMPS